MRRMQKATYRPDIEGLRAIAILAVIACHAKVPYLQGGFVGVDIFFVLSGYLITGLLIKEISESGKINFLGFYAKRLKRLLPGLALMIAITSIAAYFILPPPDQIPQSRAALSAILWLSNIGFILSDSNYFDPVTINLFQHTWSLSVEEQFYLVWPVLILWFVKSKLSPFLWLSLIFVIGFAANIYLSTYKPLWGFYSMPSRMWQFALGGIVFLLGQKRSLKKSNDLAGFAGLLIIVASVTLILEGSSYPGCAALAPSLGAALILFCRCSMISNFLSIKPMQALGKISYSWYLWHWPVLILGNEILPNQNWIYQLFLVVLSLLISIAAYYIVESPVRNNARLAAMPRQVVLGSLLLMSAGALAFDAWEKNGLTISADVMKKYYASRSDIAPAYADGCDDEQKSARVNPCVYGDPNAANTAVLFADSVGTQWFSAISGKYIADGWRFILLVKSGCPIVKIADSVTGVTEVCIEWKSLVEQYLSELQPQVLFIGSSASHRLSIDQWRIGTGQELESLASYAGRLFIIRPTPRVDFDGPRCLARLEWKNKFSQLDDCRRIRTKSPDNEIWGSLIDASRLFENVRVVDFNELVCPHDICAASDGKQIIFRDSIHVTETFVKSVAGQVGDLIDQASN
jgi:peptidoglycan/LPS O-acetylase OafA/YrhL